MGGVLLPGRKRTARNTHRVRASKRHREEKALRPAPNGVCDVQRRPEGAKQKTCQNDRDSLRGIQPLPQRGSSSERKGKDQVDVDHCYRRTVRGKRGLCADRGSVLRKMHPVLDRKRKKSLKKRRKDLYFRGADKTGD